MMDWEACSAVQRRPGKMSGAWVFAGTRVPLASLYENLACGATVEQFLDLVSRGGGTSGQGGSRIRGEDAEGFGAAVKLLFSAAEGARYMVTLSIRIDGRAGRRTARCGGTSRH